WKRRFWRHWSDRYRSDAFFLTMQLVVSDGVETVSNESFLHIFNGNFCIDSLGFHVCIDVEVSGGVQALNPAVQLEVCPRGQASFGKSFSNRLSRPFTAFFGGVQGFSLGSQIVLSIEVRIRAGQFFSTVLDEVFFSGQTSAFDS